MDMLLRSLPLPPLCSCGWGSLVIRAAEKFGTESRGITLASEQADYTRAKAKEHGVADRVCGARWWMVRTCNDDRCR